MTLLQTRAEACLASTHVSLSKKRFRYDRVSREGGAGVVVVGSGSPSRMRGMRADSGSGLLRSVRATVCEAAGAMRHTGRRRIACALFRRLSVSRLRSEGV
ncbi:hypothetical protein FU139_02305 [Burkholderia territorii]|nr:hypothetical protein FU139_02305 [Burkholderia territorii]